MIASSMLVIRADSSVTIGAGHIMRCLALAQAWHEAGGATTFVCAEIDESLEKRLVLESIRVIRLDVTPGTIDDARQTAQTAVRVGATWCVLDGYHFDYGYQRGMADAGLRLLMLDDYAHAGRYCVDTILNQNISADPDWYRVRAPASRMLLGTRYALIRREFWPWRGATRIIADEGSRVLVTLGGSDPQNVTATVLTALKYLSRRDLEICVVVGASNPHLEGLRAMARMMGCTARIEHNVSQMAGLMAWADLAVCAGGSTSWELALLGLPTCILVLAENQRAIAERLSGEDIADYAGWYDTVTPEGLAQRIDMLLHDAERRRRMSIRAQRLVDGYGAARVVAHMHGVES